MRSLTDRARWRRERELLSVSADFCGALFSDPPRRSSTNSRPRPRRHRATALARVNASEGAGGHGQRRGGHDLVVAGVNTEPLPLPTPSPPLPSSRRGSVHRGSCQTCHFLEDRDNDGIARRAVGRDRVTFHACPVDPVVSDTGGVSARSV